MAGVAAPRLRLRGRRAAQRLAGGGIDPGIAAPPLVPAGKYDGGALIAVLNVTSTGVYLLNDYIWETFHPLSPSPQDFLRLVDARQ